MRLSTPLTLLLLTPGCRLIGVDVLMDRLDVDEDGVPYSADCDDRDPDVISESDWFPDLDGDGWGATDFPVQACHQPDGHVAIGGDCDDSSSAIHPDADEVCNELDDDCDGAVDELQGQDVPTWYRDEDGDGYGGMLYLQQQCAAPEGYADNGDDCDDADPSVHPGAEERCDGVDEDCDDQIDEDAVDADTWYQDADADGWGDAELVVLACSQPSGFVGVDGDCDDADAERAPDVIEYCGDDVDQDCSGDPDDCALSGERQLDAAGLVLEGDPSVGLAGAVVLGPGDVDGDGFDDLIVSAPGLGGGVSGAVYIVHGPVSSGLELAWEADTWSGEVAGDDFGLALSSAGDHNGDGLVDLLVGAPSAGDPASGVVYLLSSPLQGTGSMAGAEDRIVGLSPAIELGGAVDGGGDVDGDGHMDVLVGAPGYPEGAVDRGRAYLFLGPITGTHTVADAAWAVGGVEGSDRVGSALWVSSDFDGDGLCDPVVSSPGWDGGAGAVHLLQGGASGPGSLDDSASTIQGGVDAALGAALASGGDVDGDGLDDLLVSAPGADQALLFVLPLGGVSSAADATASLAAETTGDLEAGGLAVLDDLYGDGRHELLVGAPASDGSRGAAYLLLGGVEGSLSLADSELVLRGAAVGDAAGVSLSGAGDMDADGWLDLIVGAEQLDAGGAGLGYLLLAVGTGDGGAR